MSTNTRRLLAVGAGLVCLASLLAAAGYCLSLRDTVRYFDSTRGTVGSSALIAYALASALAFALAARSFAGDIRERDPRLSRAALIAAAGFTAATIAGGLYLWIYLDGHPYGKYDSALIALTAYYALTAAAAAVAAVAFARTGGDDIPADRDLGLGRAGLVIALSQLAYAASMAISADAVQHVQVGSIDFYDHRYVSGLWTSAGAGVILFAAALAGSSAFSASDARLRRNALLAVAAAVFAAGFLTDAIGRTLVAASEYPSLGGDAVYWLDAGWAYLVVAAAVCAAVAFRRMSSTPTSSRISYR